jgi:tetratricopeptide (TPR) repeat protein
VDHNHPTPKELEGLALGYISASRARAVILHLLRGCEDCFQALLPYVPARYFPEGIEAPPPPFHLEDYDAPIDRAFASLRAMDPSRRTPQDIQRETVLLLAERGLEALVDAPPELSGLSLFEALLERSWALRHDDPSQMVQLARAAVLQATHLNEDEIGTKKAADLRCRAWTELANAYRVADELDRADLALSEAIYFLRQGTSADLLGARFFTVFASQQAARRLFDLACETLDIVTVAYRRHGDLHLAGRALIMKGLFKGYSGEAESALLFINRGLASVDQKRDPGLVVSAIQTQALFFVESGRFVEAHQAILGLRRRGLSAGGRVGELKLRWLEGHIHAGLQDLELAEQALREVKQGFEEAGLSYKAALAGLELGSVWFQQGNFSDAEDIVLECADVFLSLGIRRELMASLLVIRKAAESRYLSLGALQKVIDQLHKEERSPRDTPPEEP